MILFLLNIINFKGKPNIFLPKFYISILKNNTKTENIIFEKKTIMKKLLYLFVFVLFYSCSSSEEVLCDTSPSFGLITSLDISYASFRLSGSINTSDCDENFVSKGIVYSTSELPTTSDQKKVFSENDFSIEVENLSPATKYYVRAFLTNQDGEFYSNQVTVTTLNIGIEFSQISSNPMINSAEVSALFNFIEGGGYNVTSKGVIFNGTKVSDNSTSGNSIKLTLDNLTPETTYTFQTFVSTQYGDFSSTEQSFKTESSNTTISSIVATNVSYASVELNATYTNLYSGDEITTDKGFIVSLNVNFDTSTKFSSTSDSEVINATSSQLSSDTIYYIKAFVENSFGTSYGDILEISTLSAGYNFDIPVVSNISFTTADLYTQSINPTELEIVEKGFYISTSSDFSSNFQVLKDEVTTNSSEARFSATGLILNTTYYVKIYAINQYGTYTSDVMSFQTVDSGYNFSNITENDIQYSSVDLNGSYSHINSEQVDVSEFGFYVSMNENNLTSNPIKVQSGIDLKISISDLNHNAKYYYQAFVKNEFGEFKSSIFNFSTLDATPIFNYNLSSTNIQLSEVNPTLDIQIKDRTDVNSLILTYTRVSDGYSKEFNFLNEVDSDYNGGEKSFIISQLLPKTTYSLKMLLRNDYGEFESNEYTFTTLNDTPSITYSVNKSGDNSVDVVANFSTPDGASISRAFLEYKNQEESSYKSIELSVDNNNISINDLIQGPQYDYKLTIQNEWNTYTNNEYLTLPVTYKLGDEMFGGYIVSIDNTGYHGIIVSAPNNWVKRTWSTDNSRINLKGDTSPYYANGKETSEKIFNHYKNLDETSPALDYCYDFSVDGYNDWYLSSYDEMKAIDTYIRANNLAGLSYSYLLTSPTTGAGLIWTSNNTVDSNTLEDDSSISQAVRRYYNGNQNFFLTSRQVESTVIPIRQF